jgi:uncharacterized protein
MLCAEVAMNDTAGSFHPQPDNPQHADLPPTEDERNFAMLAEVLQLFAGFIPPLVIYFVKRNSRFVAFHSLQALFWQIARFVIMIVGMGIVFVTVFSVMLHEITKGKMPPPTDLPVGIFLGMGAFWLVFVVLMLVNLFIAIYYGIQAYQGKWAAYPVLGRWARKIVDE